MSDNPYANMEQYKVTANPSASNLPGSPAQTNSFANMDIYKQKGETAVTDTLTQFKDYATDTGKAAVRAGASILDMVTGYNSLQVGASDEGSRLPQHPNTKEWTPFHSMAKENLPYKHNIFGETLEGAATGAAFPGGPLVGAITGGIASGGTEAIKENFPNAPLATQIGLPLGAALITGGALAKNAGRAGHLIGEGLGIADRPALISAKDRLGVTAGTAASTVDDPLWFDMQKGLRERELVPDSKNIQRQTTLEQEQLHGATNKQANALFPNQTTQQLGTAAQRATDDGVDIVKSIFSKQEQALDNIVNPVNTHVDMRPYVDRAINDIASSPGAHIPIGGGAAQHGDSIVMDLMNNIIQYGRGNTSSVQAIRELKQKVGDHLKASLLNGDANHRELTQMYGILADAQGSAYGVVRGVNPAGAPTYTATTPQAQQYLALKAAEAEMYRSIETFGQKLVKEGITPERAATMAVNQMKLGGTQLDAVLRVMETSAPSIRNQFASETLRNLGLNNKKEFSPDRFFTRWQQVTPEARQALFGRGPNRDIPQIYDDLALVAQNQARGAKAINTSGTATVTELYHSLKAWGALIGGAGTAGYGSLAASKSDQAGGGDDNLTKLAVGAGGGAAIAHLGGGYLLGKMMTNPAFLRWLATPTVESTTMRLRALQGIAAESPELAPAINSFTEYMNTTQHRAEGGYIGYETKLTSEEEQLYNEWKNKEDYDLRGTYKKGLNPADNGHWSDEFKKPNHPTFSNESKYSKENPDLPAGSWIGEHFFPPGGYAEGGSVNDNSPFSGNVISFGKQPRGGYSGGTRNPVSPSGGGYTHMKMEEKSLLDIMGLLPANRNMPLTDNGKQIVGNIAKDTASNSFWKNLGYSNASDRPSNYAEGGSVNDNSPFNGNVISFGKQPRGGYAGGTRQPVNPSSIGVSKEKKSVLDLWVEDIANRIPPSIGNQISGYAISPKTQRGAQWETRSPMNEWSPPIDVNDAANDFTKYAEGGAIIDRFQQAVQYLTKETGMPEHAARGAVKYMHKNESKLDPNIVNPTSGAYGIAQHLGSRKTALMQKYGNKPTFENQLEHIKAELHGPENKTLQALMNSKDEKSGYDAWGKLFERPGAQALANAGVNYSPGDIKVTGTSAQTNSNSIINQIIPNIEDDDMGETNSNATNLAQEHTQNAASIGVDPLVQAVINTIWKYSDV